ncbi:hypothetical protein D0Z07_2626 [Hyphodiscus hymeniophilus]|uniref:BTB domain-containing protein n=1 Tax=Hyphodiscus hymeniophilus TaxID=353542 RepID=A0A9P6VNB0_9HELO|nr:hypothetical protein D0Z07_2626 [Hyphodiscus hymeniophilus]
MTSPKTTTELPTAENPPCSPVAIALTAENLGTEVVTLYVGPKRKQIVVHKKLLCNRIEYFSKAFDGRFKEGREGIIYLPEDDADSMSQLVDWLYRCTIPPIIQSTMPARKLYYLAEKLCVSEAMNAVMDEIQKYHKVYSVHFNPNQMLDVYRSTHERSKLRLYVAAQAACSFRVLKHRKTWDANSELFSKMSVDFFRDIMRIQLDHWDKLREDYVWPQRHNIGKGLDLCDFHVHNKDNLSNGNVTQTEQGNLENLEAVNREEN